MTGPFWEVDFETWLAGSPDSARHAAPLVLEALAPESVIDVGCGLGAWPAAFRELGLADVLGVDGPWVDRNALQIPEELFHVADLREPLELGRRFDLALCLEVAHLLEPVHAPRLVETLVGLADVVVFAAGIPGQTGMGHVNEQWPRYWADRFRAHGYLAADPFRARLWERPGVKWWFAQNTVCFAEPSAFERLPALADARCVAGHPLSLVHPECFGAALAAAAEPPRERPLRSMLRLGRS